MTPPNLPLPFVTPNNPIIALLGRRLRLAVIGGGGPGSFIVTTHRQAARLDDRIELKAACLSSDLIKAVSAGAELGSPAERLSAASPAPKRCSAQKPPGPTAPMWWPS
ncbi:MAG: hypothetical protein WEK74_10600 [Hydrogenophaga sp.]